MYEVMQSLTEAQKLQISDELEKLFTLQDRPFSSKKAAMFLEEFEKTDLPAGAIISGIRTLMYAEDIGKIEFPKILNAARSKVEHDEIKTVECDNCFKTGMVMMKDENKYEFSFLCNCANAKKVSHLNLAKWNGENIQFRRDKKFTKRFS